jgi:hypothetical protein
MIGTGFPSGRYNNLPFLHAGGAGRLPTLSPWTPDYRRFRLFMRSYSFALHLQTRLSFVI